MPDLPLGQREMVWVYHDESTFYSNDMNRLIWQDDKKDLLPKTNGLSLMVSGFMCPCHGLMRTENGEAAYTVFKPGVNRDGWWNNQDLVDQFKSVINIFEKVHPGKVAVFCCDNIVASRLNLNDGSKASKVHFMRPTNWGPNNENYQIMQYIDAQHKWQPKGARRILQERGLWIDGTRMDCKDGCAGDNVGCCARRLIANQPDFLRQAETCWLKEDGEESHPSIGENGEAI